MQLKYRQELIKPLLPLRLIKENRDAIFIFEDYSAQIVNSKNELSVYLYNNSKELLNTNDKMNFRRAYDNLVYLNNLNPDFKDTQKLIEQAKIKGLDYVCVSTKNETNMVIPERLQSDLLEFSTLGLNDKWTVYHSNCQKGIDYDYGLVINFREIAISPEQIKEKQFEKEKQVKDGLKNLIDSKGQVVKDSLGKPIKVDNMKTICINIYEFRQFKSCLINAKVDFRNLKTNQLLQTFPLSSEFIFENIYSTYTGDKNACEDNYFQYFDKKVVPFPSNEQMVYDCGEDLKVKLKEIITQNKFRS